MSMGTDPDASMDWNMSQYSDLDFALVMVSSAVKPGSRVTISPKLSNKLSKAWWQSEVLIPTGARQWSDNVLNTLQQSQEFVPTGTRQWSNNIPQSQAMG